MPSPDPNILIARAAHQARSQYEEAPRHTAPTSVIEHLVLLLREGDAVHRGEGTLQMGPTLRPQAPRQLQPMLLFRAGGLGADSCDGGLVR